MGNCITCRYGVALWVFMYLCLKNGKIYKYHLRDCKHYTSKSTPEINEVKCKLKRTYEELDYLIRNLEYKEKKGKAYDVVELD